jgi:glycosyltransferase involved in cell wall biosynthesis
MTGGPLISIVVNNYNYGRFLRRAVDSALHQTYPHTEVVVVDDGSTDDSREILASYGHRIVRVLKENGGQASAFNAGCARARGELVMFLDSDDVLLPHLAQRFADLFQTHPDVGTLQCRLQLIDAAGARRQEFVPSGPAVNFDGATRRYAVKFPGEAAMWPSGTSGTTYSGRVLAEILPMPEDAFRLCADGYVCRAATLLAPFILLDEVGAYYRIHGSNNFYVTRSCLALDTIRREVMQSNDVFSYIERFAESRGRRGYLRPLQEMHERDVLSIALRLVSRKLDAAGHPWPADGTRSLAWRGVVAASRCPNLSLALKWLHFAWFGAIAVAPRPLARWLAERKLCTESRHGVGRIVALLCGGQ